MNDLKISETPQGARMNPHDRQFAKILRVPITRDNLCRDGFALEAEFVTNIPFD